MVEVIFLGVGEAFDQALPNTSILIRWREGLVPVTMVLDCGFTAPPEFWRMQTAVDELDAIWISHFHGDHSLGLPALLVRFWQEGRGKLLTVLGQKGIESFTRAAIDLAYQGFYKKLGFPLRFVEVEPGRTVEMSGLTLRTAENSHSRRDLGLRIDAQDTSVYYSGDGRPTPESMALAKGSQLMIHEAYRVETEAPGHGTVKGALDMAGECGAVNLALVHVERGERREAIKRVPEFNGFTESLRVVVPEPGHRMTL